VDQSLFRPSDLIDQRYRLLRPLGVGGMAEVWQARHEVLDRDIAVKLVRGADPAVAERLRLEARALARLSHRAIVQVFDAGSTEGGVPFLALELVNGESLEARLLRGPLGPRSAATLIAAVCDGLAVAHAASIIHRDVKPSNILLPTEAPMSPRIVDFGVAALTSSADPKLTRAGAVVGTPAFMAPEQLKGETPDASTDVWGATVTLLEAAFGCLPFQSEDIRSLSALVLTAEPKRPAGATDQRFWDIVCRGLAKDRTERFPSAESLAKSLRAWLAGTAETAIMRQDQEPDGMTALSFDALVKSRFA
jgi:serine/threonine-protein kinase